MSDDIDLIKERLAMVLEGSEQGFWDWNIETGVVKRNDRWAQILGYNSIKDFEDTTDSWSELVHPDDREAAWSSIKAHLDGLATCHHMEYRMLSRSGDYIWVLDHAKIVKRDADGKPLRMSGIHMDITYRKKIEAEREGLIKSLNAALTQIKILHGILPICSYCKKVRDDTGYWTQIEEYIRQHSDADFSHSICPECREKYHPGC